MTAEILPDGSATHPCVLLLIKKQGDSSLDPPYLALQVRGEGLKSKWWFQSQLDRPVVKLRDALEVILTNKVSIQEVPVPSSRQIAFVVR